MQAFQRTPAGAYDPCAYDILADTGLGLRLWTGRFENLDANWLRWQNPSDQLIPTAAERADREKDRADNLAALLRAHMISPDNGLTDKSALTSAGTAACACKMRLTREVEPLSEKRPGRPIPIPRQPSRHPLTTDHCPLQFRPLWAPSPAIHRTPHRGASPSRHPLTTDHCSSALPPQFPCPSLFLAPLRGSPAVQLATIHCRPAVPHILPTSGKS